MQVLVCAVIDLRLGNPVFRCPTWVAQQQTVIFNNWYYHGLISYANWRSWFANGCNATVTPSCDALFAEAEQAIGPFDSENLYLSYCTGNSSLNFVEELVPSCTNLIDAMESYLNVCFFFF